MNRGGTWPKARVFRPLDCLLIGAIGFYQKRLSPRKGWRCAHGVLHNGPSCSGYVKSAVNDYGWRAAIPMARQRFHECKLAAHTLRRQRVLELGAEPPWPDGQGQPGRRRNQRPGAADASKDSKCEALDCECCDMPWCSTSPTGGWHAGHWGCCDSCEAPHCHGCDSCDCSPGN